MSALPSTHVRSDQSRVIEQARRISQWRELSELVDAIPDILLAVNSTRQIVFANRAALDFFHASSSEELWGLRPGEAAGCIHCAEVPGGCGDSESCKVCGAFRAIIQGLEGETPIEECRMTLGDGSPLDLRVWARPFVLDGEKFAVLSIRDISDEKRRQVLEKLFFHDLMNTAGGLQSIGEIVEFSSPEELREMRDLIMNLSQQLMDEILAQRELVAAESGQLHVELRPVNSHDAVTRTVSAYLNHPCSDGKMIRMDGVCDSVEFLSDLPLLLRVLGNLAKNALEASPEGGEVTVGCRRIPGGMVGFFVHNQGVIPKADQLQIFSRSFSTKGTGRGLGTYSVKLLTEKFLNGRARFVSSPSEQTTFFVEFPLRS